MTKIVLPHSGYRKLIVYKKSDAIYLFDPWGRLIDWMGNGL